MAERLTRRIAAASWIAGLFLLAVAGKNAAAQESDDANISEGARVYGATCGRCHNPRSPMERSDGAWGVVANHMRVRANLTGNETRSVIAFLRATNAASQRPAPVPTSTGGQNGWSGVSALTGSQAITRGHALVERSACVGCHVIGGGGAHVGPALNEVIGRRGYDYVRRKLANPAFNNSSTVMPNFRFTHDEIEAVVAFLTSLDAPERASAMRVEDPEVTPEPAPLVLRKVYFGADGSVLLTPASYQILDEVAASLLTHPDVQIEIAGYTDPSGSPQLNRRVSQARAEAVMAYLTWRGVPLERLTARGYGSERPNAQNTGGYGRILSQRVEFRAISER